MPATDPIDESTFLENLDLSLGQSVLSLNLSMSVLHRKDQPPVRLEILEALQV